MKLSGLLTIAVASLAVLSACKPSEENYRKAYEATVAKNGKKTVEGTVYNRYREMQRTAQIALADGDTISVRHENVTLTKDGGGSAETAGEYNIVVARFKQIFNAKAMSERLTSMGYSPFIVQTREPLYYVVAATCATPAEAAEQLRRISSDSRLSFQAGCPWVLQR